MAREKALTHTRLREMREYLTHCVLCNEPLYVVGEHVPRIRTDYHVFYGLCKSCCSIPQPDLGNRVADIVSGRKEVQE
jgi:hypothetical protein